MKKKYLLSVSALLFIFIACVTVPGTDRRQLNLISDSKMNRLGEQAYAQVLQKENLSKNKAMAKVVRDIGERVARASGANMNWEFNLIESDEVNAFCLPGGKVAVYTGILKVAKNHNGLATVLGHEIAHAIAKHGAERMSQAMLAQAGLTVAQLSLDMSGSQNTNLIMGALGLGAQVGVMLPFGRKHETEADVLGLKYMAKAGYDPAEAASFWKRMAAASKGSPPEFLSTHPSPSTRSRTLAKYAAEYRPKYYAHSDKQPNKNL